MPRSYVPVRGGHAGATLRDMFEHAVYYGELSEDEQHWHGQPMTVRRLSGVLWNCTDTMPGGLCEQLDLPRGSSYAQGARAVRAAGD